MSCNKLPHKLTIYRLHYKNAYTDEKELKRKEVRRETEREKRKKIKKEISTKSRRKKEKI